MEPIATALLKTYLDSPPKNENQYIVLLQDRKGFYVMELEQIQQFNDDQIAGIAFTNENSVVCAALRSQDSDLDYWVVFTVDHSPAKTRAYSSEDLPEICQKIWSN